MIAPEAWRKIVYKNKLAFFIKACMRDIDCFEQLVKSIKVFNKDNVPICVSVAQSECQTFQECLKKWGIECSLYTDEEIVEKYIFSTDAFQQKWTYQQLVKLNFYKTNFAEHYILIDCDGYFIQDFYISDFIYEDKPCLPVTGHTKAERLPMSIFYQEAKKYDRFHVREATKIKSFFGKSYHTLTLDMPFVLTSEYVKKFEEYCADKGLTFLDILKIEAGEMQWYIDFVLSTNLPYQQTTAFFMPFHVQGQYQVYRLMGFEEKDFIPNYLGILMNKGYVRDVTYKTCFVGKYIIRPLLEKYFKLNRRRYDL